MLRKNTRLAVFGLLAALYGASAQDAAPEGEVQQLAPEFQELANDKCNPAGTYKLGDETKVIPPCIAEQIIYTECEGQAGFIDDKGAKLPPGGQKMDVYKQCVLGKNSSLKADAEGCLACKKSNALMSEEEVAFWKTLYDDAATKLDESSEPKTLPELHAELRVNSKEFPKTLQENKDVTVPLEEYYPNPPRPQRTGEIEAVQGQAEGPAKRHAAVKRQIAQFGVSAFVCQRSGEGFFSVAMMVMFPDGKPAEAKPAETKPVKGKPAEAKPTEGKQAEAKPTGAQQGEKPGDKPEKAGSTSSPTTLVTKTAGAKAQETAAPPSAAKDPKTSGQASPDSGNLMSVSIYTPARHVLERKEGGVYIYVLVCGMPAPIANSTSTPQKRLESEAKGAELGLPNLNKCDACVKIQVELPKVIEATEAKPDTQKATKESVVALEGAEQNNGKPRGAVSILPIGVTAQVSAPGGERAPGAKPVQTTPNTAGTVARPKGEDAKTAIPGGKGNKVLEAKPQGVEPQGVASSGEPEDDTCE